MTRRLFKYALILYVIGSTIAAWYFFQLAKDFYIREAVVRLHPIGDPGYVRLAPDTGGTHLVFLGDSRASMWPDPDWEGFRFSNFGVARQTTGQIRLRTDDAISRSKADIYVLQAGVNDLKLIPVLEDDRDGIVQDCINNLTAIVESLKQTEARIVIVPIFPCGDVPLRRLPLWSDEITVAIREVNEALREIPNVIWLDAWEILDDGSSRVRGEFQLDLLHLNGTAYEALNDSLRDLLVAS